MSWRVLFLSPMLPLAVIVYGSAQAIHSDMRGPGGLEFCLVLANTEYLLAATHGPSVLAMAKD
ncbi:uncharacterized protein N7484_008357 [Penicillium longicatenatum]|uniref:uncharacterized protein n=1 Tax=Penicillium longicatenatum TaxID=1561947 RepID=UPI0025497044|nr:uncharacterized protein N7484_008357 [Penicillium longicatenatum]KAJ5635044.1 hypothetical protein N7484_008357 [Penicillium longicatenatum]